MHVTFSYHRAHRGHREKPLFFIENLSVLCELCGESFFVSDSLLHNAK
jgi:hypothetical protein